MRPATLRSAAAVAAPARLDRPDPFCRHGPLIPQIVSRNEFVSSRTIAAKLAALGVLPLASSAPSAITNRMQRLGSALSTDVTSAGVDGSAAAGSAVGGSAEAARRTPRPLVMLKVGWMMLHAARAAPSAAFCPLCSPLFPLARSSPGEVVAIAEGVRSLGLTLQVDIDSIDLPVVAALLAAGLRPSLLFVEHSNRIPLPVKFAAVEALDTAADTAADAVKSSAKSSAKSSPTYGMGQHWTRFHCNGASLSAWHVLHPAFKHSHNALGSHQAPSRRGRM